MSLSVIIPTSGNPRIKFLLESLILQDQIEQCEILLVTDNLQSAKAAIGPYAAFARLVLVQDKVIGHPASRLRNVGVEAARHDRVLFFDNDVVVGPGVIKKHLSDSNAIICGQIRELPADSQVLLKTFHDRSFDTLWSSSIPDYREPLFANTSGTVSVSWKNLYSGHFSILKKDFINAGGFDLTGYRCHDLEFGLRLEKLGVPIVIDGQARSIHLEHPRSLLTRIEQLNGWNLIASNHKEVASEMRMNAATSRYRIQEKLNRSLATFRNLTANFKGLKCGTNYVVTPGTNSEFIRDALNVPYEYKSKNDADVFRLRLARDCWDFSIVVPAEAVLSMPFFSILIPTWNAAGSVGRAIESIFAQSFQSFEIILIDDGSNDDYGTRIAKYFDDGRLRILYHRKNEGLSKALNTGLRSARGRYVVHVDSDDWLGSNCLEALHKVFDESPQLVATYGSPYVHDGKEIWRESGANVDGPLNHFTYPSVQAPRVYKKQALLNIGGWSINDPFDGRYYEDRLMLARIHDTGPVRYVENAVYHVDVCEGSLGRGDKKNLAASKYIILNGQAASRGKLLNTYVNGDFLIAEFEDVPSELELPSISVVIPHRNRWDYLEYCLQSWLESDLPLDAEIIVVDDGSDEQSNIAFEKLDPRVALVKLEVRQGPSVARNTGAMRAKGEFLIFCDCDHIVPKDICARMILSNRRGADVSVAAVFGKRTFTHVSPEIHPRYKEQLLKLTEVERNLKSIAASMLNDKAFKTFDAASGEIYKKAFNHHFTEKWLKNWADIILMHGTNLESYPHRWMRVNTGLLSVTKQFFDSIKGFDEQFNVSMEDWEFGIRVMKAGGTIEVCPDAEPLHQVHPQDERRVFADAHAANLLEKLHPDVIRSLNLSAKGSRPPGADIILGSIGQQVDNALLGVGTESKRKHDLFPLIKTAALTFDDGPHLTGTPIILRKLESLGIRATFFVLASQIESGLSICKTILTAGHEIGLHGWNHTPVNEFEPDELRESIVKSLETFQEKLNYKPKFYRPPYGRLTLEAKSICESLDLTIAGWDISLDDWSGINSMELIRQFAVQFLEHRSDPVILLHDGSGDPNNTSEFMTWLCDHMHSDVKFVTLSEYMKENTVREPDINDTALDFENIYLDHITLSDVLLKSQV